MARQVSCGSYHELGSSIPMSAFSDCGQSRRVGYVREVPTTDPCTAANQHAIRSLVGADQERFGEGQAERLGGLEINDQLEFAWLLDRQGGPRGFFCGPRV